MSKFKLPHDEAELANARANVRDAERWLKEYQDALNAMLQENSKAEHAEAVRKARVMTPMMLAVMKDLAQDRAYISVYRGCWYRTKPTYTVEPSGYRLNSSVFDRMLLAGYIGTRAIGGYIITDLGRKALKDNEGA